MFSAHSMRTTRRVVASTVLAMAAASVPAFAGSPIVPQLTLTPDGLAAGFTLNVFATDMPTALDGNMQPDPSGIGALGAGVDGAGRVYIADYANGGIYVFPSRTNGQSANNANVVSAIYGDFNAGGVAQVNGHIYVTGDGASQLWDINPNGQYTFPQGSLWPGWTHPKGIVSNPVTGHLYFSLGAGAGQIEEIDPVQALLHDNTNPGTSTFVTSSTGANVPSLSAFPDSLVLSADGSLLYSSWSDGLIRAYSTALNANNQHDLMWSMPGQGGLALGSGTLVNELLISTVSSIGGVSEGEVDMINLSSQAKVVIASGGGYSGYLGADPFDNSDSMYVMSSSNVYRLTAPSGGSFVDAPVPAVVPEPASLALLGIGAASLLALRGKRRAK